MAKVFNRTSTTAMISQMHTIQIMLIKIVSSAKKYLTTAPSVTTLRLVSTKNPLALVFQVVVLAEGTIQMSNMDAKVYLMSVNIILHPCTLAIPCVSTKLLLLPTPTRQLLNSATPSPKNNVSTVNSTRTFVLGVHS